MTLTIKEMLQRLNELNEEIESKPLVYNDITANKLNNIDNPSLMLTRDTFDQVYISEEVVDESVLGWNFKGIPFADEDGMLHTNLASNDSVPTKNVYKCEVLNILNTHCTIDERDEESYYDCHCIYHNDGSINDNVGLPIPELIKRLIDLESKGFRYVKGGRSWEGITLHALYYRNETDAEYQQRISEETSFKESKEAEDKERRLKEYLKLKEEFEPLQ